LLGTNSVADSYGGLRFLPQTFFITGDGRFLKGTYGIKDKHDLTELVKELLAAH